MVSHTFQTTNRFDTKHTSIYSFIKLFFCLFVCLVFLTYCTWISSSFRRKNSLFSIFCWNYMAAENCQPKLQTLKHFYKLEIKLHFTNFLQLKKENWMNKTLSPGTQIKLQYSNSFTSNETNLLTAEHNYKSWKEFTNNTITTERE